MTDEELREHWGETDPAPREPRRWSQGHLLVAIGLGILLLAALMPGILREAEQTRREEIRQCEMAKVLGGVSLVAAELLCERQWAR